MNKELIKKENSVSKKESTSLQVYDLKPLLYRPDLKVSDVLSTNGISTEQKSIILASLNEIKLKFIDLVEDKNSWNTLKDILVKTIWESGIGMEKADQKLFITVAIDDIKNEFEMLTVSDVRIALKNGVRKKYGEFYGMNITTLNVWLKTYQEQTKIEAMLKLPLVKPIEEEKIYTEEEKLENHRIWIEGLIRLTHDEKLAIREKALLEFKSSKSLKNAKSAGERADFKHILENLQKENEKPYEEQIKLLCKKIVINNLFNDFAKKEKSLREMVEKLEKRKSETNQ